MAEALLPATLVDTVEVHGIENREYIGCIEFNYFFDSTLSNHQT